jgi:hypothetical protein
MCSWWKIAAHTGPGGPCDAALCDNSIQVVLVVRDGRQDIDYPVILIAPAMLLLLLLLLLWSGQLQRGSKHPCWCKRLLTVPWMQESKTHCHQSTIAPLLLSATASNDLLATGALQLTNKQSGATMALSPAALPNILCFTDIK